MKFQELDRQKTLICTYYIDKKKKGKHLILKKEQISLKHIQMYLYKHYYNLFGKIKQDNSLKTGKVKVGKVDQQN